MSPIKNSTMKRILYFNVTYGCNSNCLFCYSHNTWHTSKSHNEIDTNAFFSYMDSMQISSEDRVIINGGEPLLHSEIMQILNGLKKYNCEVLIYTNGRRICNYDLSNLDSYFRFIVPIHGDERIHDYITQVNGSYKETIKGLKYLVDNTDCLVDVKLILNNKIVSDDVDGRRTLYAFSNDIVFNNAIHLTKMADTILSMHNGCTSVTNNDAAKFNAIFFEYFKGRNKKIKIFDTCIKNIIWIKDHEIIDYKDKIEVHFKDKNEYRVINPTRKNAQCMIGCPVSSKCISAVNEYKSLECYANMIYENLE